MLWISSKAIGFGASLGTSLCSEPCADLERVRGGRDTALPAGAAGSAGGGRPSCGVDMELSSPLELDLWDVGAAEGG